MRNKHCSVVHGDLRSASMQRTTRAKKTRKVITVAPKYTLPLINAELRTRKNRSQKAALRSLIEEAVIAQYGPRYPKILAGIPSLFLPATMGSKPTPAVGVNPI